MASDNSILAIDIGGQSIRAGVVAEDGSLAHRASAPTPVSDADAFGVVIAGLTSSWGPFSRVGVSVPGHVISESGNVAWAPNLYMNEDGERVSWKDVPLGKIIEEAVGVWPVLMNDANAAGVAEFMRGAGRGAKTLIHLTLGTGVGGAVIFAGSALWPPIDGWTSMVGAGGGAGELGHARTGRDPDLMSEGGDTLEARCGAKYFAPIVRANPNIRDELAAVSDRDLLLELYRLAESGNESAVTAWYAYGRDLGAGIGSFINIFGPDRITLGGQVANAIKYFETGMKSAAQQIAIPTLWDRVQILQSSLGDDAGLLGAAEAARSVT